MAAGEEVVRSQHPAADRMRGRMRPRRRSVSFEQWALLPLLIVLALFVFFPLMALVRASFSTVTMTGGGLVWEFSGLANATAMRQDEIFRAAMVNTTLFVVASVAVQLVLGTALALLVDRARVLGSIAKNILIWPAILTPVAISVTWWLILTPEFGQLNRIFALVGLPRQAWLASTTWALPAVIAVDVWHWTPIVFLIVLAGLAGIDRSLYEAARVDGASDWQILRHVTMPLLVPTLVVAAIIRTVLGFKVFDEIYVLTSGGPGTATEVLSSYVQSVFFEQFRMGYGAFLGLTVTVIVVIVVIVYLFVLQQASRVTDQA